MIYLAIGVVGLLFFHATFILWFARWCAVRSHRPPLHDYHDWRDEIDVDPSVWKDYTDIGGEG